MTTMELGAYPRPRGDTGLALRLAATPGPAGTGGGTQWIDDVKRSGVSWLIVPSTLETPPGEALIRGLVARGVEVIVELDCAPIEPFDPEGLRALCRDLARWGARYAALFRHANLASSWRMTEWAPAGHVERFGALLLPALESAAMAGLIPIVGALAPGGHYWDLVFLDRLLVYLARHAREAALDRLGIGYDWPISNRPVGWGRGGPSAWTDVGPYRCPVGSQDHRGFYLFEWYDAAIRHHLGRSLPLFCLASGPSPTVADHPDLPPLDEEARRGQILEVARLAADGRLPDYVFAVGAWPYTPGAAKSLEALYSLLAHDNGATAAEVLRQIVSHPRPAGELSVDPPLGPEPGLPPAAIAHYLYFHAPGGADRPVAWGAQTMLLAALDYIRRLEPTIGFRMEEAAGASWVTLVGSDAGELKALADSLSQPDRRVEVVVATSAPELKRALDRLGPREPIGRPA
jgi:hypothetical protein